MSPSTAHSVQDLSTSKAQARGREAGAKQDGKRRATATMDRLDKVMKAELASIVSRRRLCGLPVECSRSPSAQGGASDSPDRLPADVRGLDDTFGVCFSGGGLRSTAFSAGVLSALSTSGWLKRVDYISCVSGGSCTAASFISHATGSRWNSKERSERDVPAHLAASAESAVNQLRSNSSSPTTRGNAREMAIFSLQVAGVLTTCLATAPLAAICVAIIFSRTLESFAGDEIRLLLSNGLVESHWLEINGWFFFFTLTTAMACTTFAHMQSRRTLVSPTLGKHPGSSGLVASPAGQMAKIIVWIIVCFDAVIIIMFLDERLFKGTLADEFIQAGLALVWVYSIFALVFGDRAVDSRHETIVRGMWSLQAVSIVWVSARICVLRVTGRLQGTMADEYAWVCITLWAVAHDYISRSFHPLLRQRLRLAFLRMSSNSAGLDPSLLLPPPKSKGAWSGNARWHPPPSTPPACSNIGDIYYGHAGSTAGASTGLAASPSRRVGKPPGSPQEDADGGDPPLGELEGDMGMPYLLINLEASGYVRRRAVHSKGSPQWDDNGCSFLLSPRFCGSERTGYFRTPNPLSLSSALAMCCASDPFSAASSDVVDGVRERFIRQVLSTGDWLPLKPTPTAFSSRVAGDIACLEEGNETKSPSGGDTKNPVPNFCLDPTGSVPVTKAGPGARPSPGLSHIHPWLARALVPAIAVSTLMSLAEPTFLVVPLGMGLAALLLTFLPEGRSLLFSPQLRGMHRLLGAVHSSDRPPPFVHLSDGAAADRVGLIELLRRRCTRIMVCDATSDAECEFSDLLQAMERARRELGCAFMPPRGESGDVSTLVREFQSDGNERCLRLRVEYFARPSPLTPSMVAGTCQWRSPFHARGLQEDVVKSGEIWILKSRVTAQDSDIPLPLPSKGRAMQAGKLLCCSMLQKLFASTEWCQNLTRRIGNIWLTSCVDAEPAPHRPYTSQRFFSPQTFTHFSALGARATWAALETFDDENADSEEGNVSNAERLNAT